MIYMLTSHICFTATRNLGFVLRSSRLPPSVSSKTFLKCFVESKHSGLAFLMHIPARCTGLSLLHLAQRDGRAAGEEPEGWVHSLGEGEYEGVDGISPVCHVVEGGSPFLEIHQHADALGVGVGQHGLTAVVPGRHPDVEPLHAPGLGVAAQAAGGPFAVDAAVGQTHADEVVAAQPHLPVVAS